MLATLIRITKGDLDFTTIYKLLTHVQSIILNTNLLITIKTFRVVHAVQYRTTKEEFCFRVLLTAV